MNTEKIIKFIKDEDKRQRQYYPSDSIDKEVFARAVKLIEEVGEFFDYILKISYLQRKQKDAKYKKRGLEGEFADIIITSLLLAKALNINVDKSIQNRILEIENRYKNNIQ